MDVEVVVEIPQGSRNKYEMDHASGRIRLDRMLFTSIRYPLDYGFIPGTLAEDGDPLDAMVMTGEPAFPGCYVLTRPVGVFWLADELGPDAKILTVHARNPRFAAIRDLADVPADMTAEIGHFFDIYKELEPGKSPDGRGWQDRASAEQVISAARTRASGYGVVQSFGTGAAARRAAMRTADELRANGIAAAPTFQPSMGGWAVRIYPGGIRQRPARRTGEHDNTLLPVQARPEVMVGTAAAGLRACRPGEPGALAYQLGADGQPLLCGRYDSVDRRPRSRPRLRHGSRAAPGDPGVPHRRAAGPA